MGNTEFKKALENLPAHNYERQADCSLSYLPEELSLAIVEYLDLRDFICLITTCKYYNYDLLGQSNILWAHICRTLGNVNFIIKTIQFGRRWRINGQAADLNKEIDLRDENALAAFNFREIIEEYYLRILHKSSLRVFVQDQMGFLSEIPAVNVEILEYSPVTLRKYWLPEKPGITFRKDYFFVVDLYLDPESFNKLLLGLKQEKELPYSKGGRIVAYQKSKNQPKHHPAEFFNRIEKEREFSRSIAAYNELLAQNERNNDNT